MLCIPYSITFQFQPFKSFKQFKTLFSVFSDDLNGLNDWNYLNRATASRLVARYSNPQHLSRSAYLPASAKRTTDPSLSPIDFCDARSQLQRLTDGRRLKIGNMQVGGDVPDARRAPDGPPFTAIGVGNSQIQAVAIDQRSDDSTVNNLFGSTAVMRLRFPGSNSIVSIPGAFNLQTLTVVRPASVTEAYGALILERLLAHTRSIFYFSLSSFNAAELMQ
jgi:hypothetical protein